MVSQDNSFIEVTGANPAAGAEISDSITNLEEIFGMKVTLVADATVANRDVTIQLKSAAGTILGYIKSATSITASQTVAINVGKFDVLPANTSTNHYYQLPNNIQLYPGCIITTVTANLQAGDNFGSLVRVVKQNEVSTNPA